MIASRHSIGRYLLIAGCFLLYPLGPSVARSVPGNQENDFPVKVVGGYGDSDDPRFYSQWMYNQAYMHALAEDHDPALAANKRVVVEFEAELARALKEGRIDRDIDAIIARYTTEDYHQMDPNIADGRQGLSAWFKAGGMHKGSGIDSPPPPVALIADHDSVAMILKLPPAPSPDPTVESRAAYMISVFRVRNGRLATHYSSAVRGAYWCHDCTEKQQ